MSGSVSPGVSAAPAAALLGFFSVAAQTILARELLVFFHGSELSLGLVLAVWLVLGGAGSALAGHLLRRRRPSLTAVAATAAAAAVALPAGVLGARWAGVLFPLLPGVVPGVRDGALAALALLAMPAAAGGAWFAIAAALGRDARGPGRAYAWESAGGLAGGAVVAAVFAAGALDAFTLSTLIGAGTLALAAGIVPHSSGRAARPFVAGLAA
ncbi:MAG TPA: hypothetical protein VN317_08955, partial [Candidatus Methanoperedens sp.]|nr:hypothetical protein [Candidatus Methanoperedens sp.]